MADSFEMRLDIPREPAVAGRRVAITGAAGTIGSYFAQYAHDRYDLRLMVRPDEDASAVEPYGQVVRARLEELQALKDALCGVDTIVHLAANASPEAVWNDLLRDNIVGTYNTFVAAEACGCRRVIFASSIHAVGGYSLDRQVQADDPVNPGDLYGVSKCFGEAMARYMAMQRGLSSIVVRIGAFQPVEAARQEGGISLMNIFVSNRDLAQLFVRCIDDVTLQFAIIHGLSGNLFNRMNIEETRELLGYQPQDDFAMENPLLKDILDSHIRPDSERGRQSAPGIREQLEKIKSR